MAKIVGNVVGIPNPQTDWSQTDETKADYLKNRNVLESLIDEKLDIKTFNEFVESGGGTYDEIVLTVDDVTPTLSDDDIYLEGHRTVPNVDAVKTYVNGKIVTNYGDWFDNTDGSDYDTKVPSIGIVSDFFEYSGFLSESNIVTEIKYDPEDYAHMDIPNTSAVIEYVASKLHPTPITEAPVTLVANKEYNFGWVSELSLSFPTIANDGDVIYVTFFAEDSLGGVPNLVIDTTNTSDIELIPEQSTGYEVFAKYNGEIWIVNYSEYTKW